jgi:hypothetical protein
MITVNQLIAELQKVKDKNLFVFISTDEREQPQPVEQMHEAVMHFTPLAGESEESKFFLIK